MASGTDYADKTVLITGGTGSFGRKMARRLLDRGVGKIKIFSRDEAKQHFMRVEFGDPRLEFHIGDVRDRQSVDHSMADGVDLIFHAAALKQVPSCEFFPLQAVWTNVIGSANVVESAQSAGVGSVVCLSTDKAVMPVNAMGMSKALMEKVAQSSARRTAEGGTVVSSVRYGNVLYSRGSVVPLFVDQINNKRSLTITDPAMTRFLLPLEVAVDLVEHAFAYAEPGDIFIRKAPASTVADLAEAVRQLMEVDNPIEVIGVRHGEKLYETLATSEELRHAQDMGDYWRLRMDGRGLDYDQYFTEGDEDAVGMAEDYHSHNTERLDVEATKDLLLELPEMRRAIADWQATR